MIGQDSVKTARGFNDRLDLSGVILTKLDSDTRGGAALNVLEITGAPVLFEGSGETVEQLKKFRPEGMASRVLGMGDVVGLAQDLEKVIDEKQAQKEAEKMLKGQFTLDDFLNQIRTIQKMGPMKDILEKMPGMSQMLPPGAAADVDDSELPRIESMIQSMTRFEKQDPNALIREPGRVKRIAQGSGREEKEVSEMVQKFLFMQQMMGSLGGGMGGGGGMMDMLGNLPGMKGLNMARNMRRAMKSGKMPPGMPDLSSMMGGGGGMPDLSALMGGGGMPPGFPNLGGPGTPAASNKMRVLSKAEKNARKNQRKSQKQARKRKK